MPICFQAGWKLRLCLPLLPFLMPVLNAQTTLVLSSATATSLESASLELSLDSSDGVTPAAVQWTFQYPAAAIRSITVEDGPALVAAGKTVLCGGDASAYTCLAVGLNAELIPDGVVAKVIVELAPDENGGTLAFTDAIGVSAAGHPIPIYTKNGNVTRPAGDRRPLPLRQRVGEKQQPGK